MSKLQTFVQCGFQPENAGVAKAAQGTTNAWPNIEFNGLVVEALSASAPTAPLTAALSRLLAWRFDPDIKTGFVAKSASEALHVYSTSSKTPLSWYIYFGIVDPKFPASSTVLAFNNVEETTLSMIPPVFIPPEWALGFEDGRRFIKISYEPTQPTNTSLAVLKFTGNLPELQISETTNMAVQCVQASDSANFEPVFTNFLPVMPAASQNENPAVPYPSSTPSATGASKSKKLSSGAIAGIAIASVVILGLIIFGIVYGTRQQRQQKTRKL